MSSTSFSKYLSVRTSFLFLSVPYLWMYTSLRLMHTTVRALVSGGYMRINPRNTVTRRTMRERLSINLASPSPPCSPLKPPTTPTPFFASPFSKISFCNMPGLHHREALQITTPVPTETNHYSHQTQTKINGYPMRNVG